MDPIDLTLLPGDRVKSAESIPWHRPSRSISVDDLIANMAGVASVSEVGSNGLAIASRAMNSNQRGEGLYEAEFARDALMMAKFGDERFPLLTEATVIRLAQVQGITNRPGSDNEQVGRIPHEIRPQGDPIREMMTAKFGWEWPYFGSVDATPLFVSAAVRAERRTPGFFNRVLVRDDGTSTTVGAAVLSALSWIQKQTKTNNELLIESEIASNGC